jgi:hypothetical protein
MIIANKLIIMIKYKIKGQYKNFKDKFKKNIKYLLLINYILSLN